MKMIDLTSKSGLKIAIPVEKITGIIGTSNSQHGQTFIATGADGADGGENGWYVAEKYIDIRVMLEAM